MRKIIFSLLIAFCAANYTIAQDNDDQILMTINGEKITRGEFERIYTKNNQDPAFDKASLDEYMKLFINFKLKVMEAESLGMDTVSSFVTELNGYRRQLEKPYFTDDSVDEALIREAYERMKWDIRASHILIRCPETASAADTLKAFKEITDIRKRALKGEDFSALAKKYSQDPSAARNGGDLGYFTAFSMVYPFEAAAYSTPVGKISNVFRSRFGYHIIYVADKRPDRGEIKVAHIMCAVPQGSSAEKDQEELTKINAIYDSIQAGASFEEMAKKYSDDRGSSQKGGELPFFGTGRMIPEFEQAAFALKQKGEVSKPIKTNYGYHIIKLLDVRPIGSYEDLASGIKNKISKDVRAQKGREMVIRRLKKEYNVLENKKALVPFYTLLDSTIYQGKWDASKAKGLNDVILTIADTNKYTQQDFANSISNDAMRRLKKPFDMLANEEFNRFVEKKLTDFEKSRLEVKYPEFRNLVKEYHDGILLFNLTDKMVWTKAVQDTAGLEKFYNENKNNYMWGDRVEATLYTFNDKNYEKQVAKLAAKVGKKDLNTVEARTQFMAKIQPKDTLFTLTVVKNKFSKGDSDIIDAVTWEPGLKDLQVRDSSYILVYVNRTVAPEPKLLSEARGLITADYQNYLEKLWLDQLRKKYVIKTNDDVFNSMVK